jgi:AraC-like DNA-binding protein
MASKRQALDLLFRSARIGTLTYDYPPKYTVPPHQHRLHQLLYARRGVMSVRTPERSLIVPPERGVWIPAGTEHSIRMSGEVALRTLYLGRRLSPLLPTGGRVFQVNPLFRELILCAVAQGPLDGRRTTHEHLIRLIVDQIRLAPLDAVQLPYPRDPRAVRVANLIQENPADERHLDALAASSGGSARTIERIFRAETGMTFGKWRQQVRLAQALRRLADGQSVSATAFHIGYESVSAFISAFRRTFGEPPRRYLHTLDR